MKSFGYLFLLATLLSNSAQAGFLDKLLGGRNSDSSKPYCKSYGPKLTGWMAGPKPLFSPDETNSIYNQIDQKNLGSELAAFPKSYEEIFFEGKDIKAQIIEERAKESEKFWSEQTERSLQAQSLEFNYKELKFDISAWQDLNLQAAKVWNSLSECNQGQTDKMRLNYFRGIPCSEDQLRNASITTELAELNSSLALLVMSTPIWYPLQMPDPEISYIHATGISRVQTDVRDIKICAQLGNGRYHGVAGNEVIDCSKLNFAAQSLSFNLAQMKLNELWLPKTHPLLAQMILQYQALYSLLAYQWKRNFYLRDIEKEMFMDEVGVKYSKSFANEITERKTKFPNEAKANVRYAMKFGILASALIDSKPNTPEYTACSVYGLWPAMNRSVLFATGGMMDSPEVFQEPMISAKRKALLACGSRIEYLREGQGVYSNFAYLHLVEMSRLVATYWPEKIKDSEISKAMKETGLTPYQKQLCNN